MPESDGAYGGVAVKVYGLPEVKEKPVVVAGQEKRRMVSDAVLLSVPYNGGREVLPRYIKKPPFCISIVGKQQVVTCERGEHDVIFRCRVVSVGQVEVLKVIIGLYVIGFEQTLVKGELGSPCRKEEVAFGGAV